MPYHNIIMNSYNILFQLRMDSNFCIPAPVSVWVNVWVSVWVNVWVCVRGVGED